MNSVIVTANLGHLKAFRLVQTPNRGVKLELIDEMNFLESHGRYFEKTSDQAGRFPVSEGKGPRSPMATGEALTAEVEIHRRLAKQVAEQVESILRWEKPQRWHLAAPAESCNRIVEALSPEARNEMRWTVHADLTKVPADEVLRHFL